MKAETTLPCYGCTGYTSAFRAPVNNNIRAFFTYLYGKRRYILYKMLIGIVYDLRVAGQEITPLPKLPANPAGRHLC